MSVQILCPDPGCGASYSVVEEQLGKLGRCKKCGTKFALVPPTSGGGPPSSVTDLESAPRSPASALPESFGRYQILRMLGRGGMGSVYLALDTALKRQVALKVPHIVAFGDRPEVRTRFFREAEAAARFQHPNFCPIFDIGEADGVPFLTMAFIEGQTLAASIERGKGWPERRAAEVARELAHALAELHRQGIVHRDLKPANVMVNPRGTLILMDFGLARWYDELDSTFTPTGAILGTPAYMPPEQAEGRLKAIGPRSDVYSLGVILYELLTGRRPFEGPITRVLGMISFAEPPPPSTHRTDLDRALESIVLKAMAKKPEDRHASMDEFAKVLTAYLSEGPIPSVKVASRPAAIPAEQVVDRKPATIGDGKGKPPAESTWEPFEDRPRGPRRPILSRIVGLAALAALLSGIIIYVATDRGRIKIEVNDPTAVVRVDGQEVRIEGVGEPITLRSGEHVLSVKRGDIEVETRKFVVRRGDNPALSVVLEPIPSKAVPSGELTPPAVVKVEPPPTEEAKKVEVPKPQPTTDEVKKAEVPKPSEKLMPTVETPPPAPPKVDVSLITNTLGMKLKLIPAGEFLMGSDASDPDASEDEKVDGKKHPVRITRPFYLGTTEVTVGQFRQFVEKASYPTEAERDGKGGYGWDEAKATFTQDPKYTWRSPGFPQTDDHPVVNVSWNDAVAFCEWLSQQEGKTYRLPTEAEWEYSCRAGQATRYSSGDDPETLATFGNVADKTAREKFPDWTYAIKAPDGYVFTAPVGRFHGNAFDLYDMHGNVWEWCDDWYASDYYSKAPRDDPRNSSRASARVFRGGSCYDFPRRARSANRHWFTPGFRSLLLGFRVARVQ